MLGNENYKKTLEKQEVIYSIIKEQCKEKLWFIRDEKLFNSVIENFGPMVKQNKAQYNLMDIYNVAFHRPTGTLIVANKGAILYSLSPRSFTPYITHHIGLSLYIPNHGTEIVNVGLVGNIYNDEFILRSESACTPSFLFGSQRCNCAHQWDVFKEVAAAFNKIDAPKIENGVDFEKWVQEQVTIDNDQYFPKKEGLGFVLMHIDTQNGMGSGYTENEFSHDLYTRSSLRHRGEYTSEQVFKTTMAGGFHAIGISPDPRSSNKGSGYNVTATVLDYLKAPKKVVFLTNNPLKMKALTNGGYQIKRVKYIGEVSLAGAKEAYERGVEFDHLDIDDTSVTFEEEFQRVCSVINYQLQENLEVQYAN